MTLTKPLSPGPKSVYQRVTQGAYFLVGFLLAWFLTGQAWVQFDSFVPTAIAAATLTVTGALAFRLRHIRGLGIGIIVGAISAMIAFYILATGPTIP